MSETRHAQYCKFNIRSKCDSGPRYICDTCKTVWGHQGIWCPTCPGKLVQFQPATFKELLERCPEDYEWGEDRSSSDINRLSHNNLWREYKKGERIPTLMVIYLPEVWAPQLLSTMGKPFSGPLTTSEPGVITYSYKFETWGAANEAKEIIRAPFKKSKYDWVDELRMVLREIV
jgi:hypothetical protein